MGSERLVIGLGLAALLAHAGCSVKAEDIERWKTTQKGPQKIAAAFADSSLSADLKARAGAALVELGLLAELEKAMEAKSPPEREMVLKDLVPRLAEILKRPTNSSRKRQISTTAKDAAFALRTYAPPPLRDTLDKMCIDWFLADVPRRAHLGQHDLAKVFTAIGPRAGSALVPLLTAGRQDLLVLAELVGKLAPPDARAQAGDKLVALLKAEGDSPREETLKAVGLVDSPGAVKALVELAQGAGPEERRVKALQALAVKPVATDEVLGLAGKLAGDVKAPLLVRDAALDLLEKIGSKRKKDALGVLYGFLGDLNSKLRWRSVEAILAVGKTDVLPDLLAKLPVTVPYVKQDVDDFMCADIRKNGGVAAVPHLRKALGSSSWVARAIAVRCLEALGKPDDAAKLEPLFADATPLKGWGESQTLGAEARLVANKLRSK